MPKPKAKPARGASKRGKPIVGAPIAEDAQAWDQQPGESKEAYAAFLIYRDMEAATRSIREAYRKATGRHEADGQPWREFSAKWSWPIRAEAWDNHLRKIDQAATEAMRERQATRREKMRLEQVDREIGHAAKLEEKALKLLSLPHVVATAKYEDGRIQTQAPAHASEFRAAMDLLSRSSQMMRRALEMPLDITRTELTGKDGEALPNASTALTDEERLNRVVAILDAARARRVDALATSAANLDAYPEQSAGDGIPESSG